MFGEEEEEGDIEPTDNDNMAIDENLSTEELINSLVEKVNNLEKELTELKKKYDIQTRTINQYEISTKMDYEKIMNLKDENNKLKECIKII